MISMVIIAIAGLFVGEPSFTCDFSKITEIKDVFSATPDDGLSLSSAILLSKITSHVTEEASLPTSAVLFHQNLNTLIGAFAGMMISICFLSFWQPGKK